MNCYLLYRLDPGGPDEYEAKVIVANSNFEARILANVKTADEGKIWHDPIKVSCAIVDMTKPHIVLEAFHSG